jgi:hypothetical protein
VGMGVGPAEGAGCGCGRGSGHGAGAPKSTSPPGASLANTEEDRGRRLDRCGGWEQAGGGGPMGRHRRVCRRRVGIGGWVVGGQAAGSGGAAVAGTDLGRML